MKALLGIPLLIGALLLAPAGPAWSQAAPADFELTGTAGGTGPDDENVTIRVTAAGQGTYVRYRPNAIAAAPLESVAFTLSQAQLDQLWQSIVGQGFFALAPTYETPGFRDRTFASLTIRGDASTAMVTTRNIAVPAFDAIVAALNGMTPGTRDLVYDTSPAPTYTPQDGCGGIDAPELQAKPFGKGLDRRASAGGSAPSARASRDRTLVDPPQAGTTVAHRISLQEAASRGIVTLAGKGGFYGDQVAITADNTGSVTSPRLDMTLNLELYGPTANAANAAAIRSAIESRWGGKTTTGGETMNVKVNTRVSSSNSPPGTAGYHQIKLDTDANIPTSYVFGTPGVNSGTGTGTWRTTGSELANMFAHEAGHLMGFPDRYDGYAKQPNGSWKLEGGNTTYTADQLTDILAANNPAYTKAQIKDWLNQPGTTRTSTPQPGSANDLMADKSKNPVQSDIDAIAGQAGLVVEVRPGDVLVNKDGGEQNFAVTRTVDLYVPRGQTRTLQGLWVACIDLQDHSPSFGAAFDVAPRLSDWSGIPAAAELAKLVNYVDQNDRYCGGDFDTQYAIWRISNDDPNSSPSVQQLLSDAGVVVGPDPFGFPRLSDPNAGSPGTALLVPPELIRLGLAVSPGDRVDPGQTVGLTASLSGPTGWAGSAAYSWSLVKPAGSAATLGAATGPTASFHADHRGFYRLTLHADLAAPLRASEPGRLTAGGALERVFNLACTDARTATFETGAIAAGPPFEWATTGDGAWQTDASTRNSGAFSARSPALADAQQAGLGLTLDLAAAGELQFARRVSSESGYDLLEFRVDGVVEGSWSGESDWQVETFPLAAGSHTLEWRYAKDPSVSAGADRAWIDDVFFPATTLFVAVEPTTGQAATAVSLAQNYPNPCSGITSIPFALPRPGHVRIAVYDMAGREVQTLADGDYAAGRHVLRFDTGRLPPGIYSYRMIAGDFREVRRLVRVR